MKISFSKYQGAGNDFVLIDDRPCTFPQDVDLIKKICNRRFGIGADGLILLQNDNKTDFKMVYFNADGNLGSMCGNGGRCVVAFAKALYVIDKNCSFAAYDGIHQASISDANQVKLHMSDVGSIDKRLEGVFLDTGSPHLVCFQQGVEDLDVDSVGARIRYSSSYKEIGTNVNFAERIDDYLLLRTYERGVEAETLACGTGATATAIAAFEEGLFDTKYIKLKVKGGHLEVSFEPKGNSYSNICLTGPAEFVFSGEIEINV